MTNNEVVQRFFERKSGKSLHMRTDGVKLFSYSTCMAEWHDGRLYINATKYSRTTTKQMSSVWHYAVYYSRTLVSGAERGVYSIYSFFRDTDKSAIRKRKMLEKFNKFIADVKYFLLFDASTLSAASKDMLRSLIDSAKCNNYHKQRDKFLLVKANIESRKCNDFKRKMGLRHKKDKTHVRSFAFSI